MMASPVSMLTVSQAEALILDRVQPFNPDRDQEVLALDTALGRILARSVCSHLDFPHWHNSAMDGYAVRFSDVVGASDAPIVLTVASEIPAGQCPSVALQPGEAARIFTGAMLPEGADTIVMQENTQQVADRRVRILTAPPRLGQFVRRRGEFYQAGQPLLAAGCRLGATELAILAAAQCPQVSVYRRPKVALFSTGDELVPPDRPLQPGQIVDSNRYALSALLTQAGAEPWWLGIVPDQPAALRQTLTLALTQADVVLSSGGVSVGDYDYIEPILRELDATLQITAVAIKPGKPLTFATFDRADDRSILFFGLPGNPASALVTFWRFVQPALTRLAGLATGGQLHWLPAQAAAPLRSDPQRETYLWGQTTIGPTGYRFHPAGGGHHSGNLINLAGINCLAKVPLGGREIALGEPVTILAIG